MKVFKMTNPNKSLCDYCLKNFSTCDAGDIGFNDDDQGDNIILCGEFLRRKVLKAIIEEEE